MAAGKRKLEALDLSSENNSVAAAGDTDRYSPAKSEGSQRKRSQRKGTIAENARVRNLSPTRKEVYLAKKRETQARLDAKKRVKRQHPDFDILPTDQQQALITAEYKATERRRYILLFLP
jgi:hypothetical protein